MLPEGITGPKTVQPGHLKDAVALTNRIFRKEGGDMGKDYPLVFHPDRLEQLRIFEKDGLPVSLVGNVINDVVLLGCSLRIACLGAVCTDEAIRGGGLAGTLVNDAVAKARAAGVSVMLISGRRTSYTRRGAVICGRFDRYLMPLSKLPQRGGDIQIVEVLPRMAESALRVFENEPIRFRRTPEEYSIQISSGKVRNRPGATFLMQSDDKPVAVASVNSRTTPAKDGRIAGVKEIAGCRRAVLASLSQIAGGMNCQQVEIDAYPTDVEMRQAAREIGVEPKTMDFEGTIKLIDPQRLWREMGPLICERIGPKACADISISFEADELKIHKLTFRSSSEEVTLDSDKKIMAAFFGATTIDPWSGLSGELVQTLRRALPLPMTMYGMNFV